jgi:hypothetical protein
MTVTDADETRAASGPALRFPPNDDMPGAAVAEIRGATAGDLGMGRQYVCGPTALNGHGGVGVLPCIRGVAAAEALGSRKEVKRCRAACHHNGE